MTRAALTGPMPVLPVRPGARSSTMACRSVRLRRRSCAALELTFREALRLGHSHGGTEHILLALLELEDGSGTLTGLGLDKAATEASVTGQLSRPAD
jgi:Clp amino terminal domain, pathogenicity island component